MGKDSLVEDAVSVRVAARVDAVSAYLRAIEGHAERAREAGDRASEVDYLARVVGAKAELAALLEMK